jgi:hypothetical protein
VQDFTGLVNGTRVDKRHLLDEWENYMVKNNKKHKFIWNATDLRSLDPNAYDHVFGIIFKRSSKK